MIRSIVLTALGLVLTAGLAAAEGDAGVVARWGQGFGHVAGDEADVQTQIRAGAPVVAQDRHPVRLYLAKSPGSSLIVGAGSRIVLHEEQAEVDGAPVLDLVVGIEAGVVQLDLVDRGPYRRVLLRGSASEAEVFGTLLTGERVSAQEDYFVLVKGLVRVRLRQEVAEALHVFPNEGVELGPQQGVGATTATGLGQVQVLAARPQLVAAADERKSTKEQATEAPADGEPGWAVDEAAAMLDGMMEEIADTGNTGAAGGGAVTDGAEPAVVPGVEPAEAIEPAATEGGGSGGPAVEGIVDPGITALVIEEAVVDELVEAVNDDLVEELIDDGVIIDEVIESVTEGVIEAQQELGDFPEPP